MIERTSPRSSGKACSSSCRPMPFDCRPGRTNSSVSSKRPPRSIDRAYPISSPPSGASATHHSAACSARKRWTDSMPSHHASASPCNGVPCRRPRSVAEVHSRSWHGRRSVGVPRRIVGADAFSGTGSRYRPPRKRRVGAGASSSCRPMGSVYHPAVRHRASRLVGPQATESVAFGQLNGGTSSAWRVRQLPHSETHASPADRCRNGG